MRISLFSNELSVLKHSQSVVIFATLNQITLIRKDRLISIALALSFTLFMCSSSFVVRADTVGQTALDFENPTSNRILRPFHAIYTAFRSNKEVGDVELKLSNEYKNQYELFYKSDISRFFLTDQRQETTSFITLDNKLKPVSYQYKRTGTGPNKDLTLEFDHINKVIDVNNEKEIPWQGEFENQLFRIDVPYKLSLGETQFSYDFVNYRGQKRQYQLEVIGTESLSLPYGTLNALKVVIERKSNTRITYAWFAPTLNYNLVRLQQFKDDKEQGDMLLSQFKYL